MTARARARRAVSDRGAPQPGRDHMVATAGAARPHPTAGRVPRWLVSLLAASLPAAAAAAPPSYTAEVRPLLARYCSDCHAGDSPAGGVGFDHLTEAAARTTERAAWQKVLRQVEASVMPPADVAQPTADERATIVRWITDHALVPDCSGGERPGRVTLRRLNRAEYDNTVRDLFGVTVRPAADFPADDIGYGFDHIGDVLSLPPVLLERYLTAAEQVTREVVFIADEANAAVRSFPGKTLPSTGEVPGEFEAPAPAAYVIRVKASGDQAGPDPARMAVRVDGEARQTFDVPNRQGDPRDYEVRLELPAGRHTVAAAFLNDYYKADDPDPKNRDRNLHVERIDVVGPIGLAPEHYPEPHRRFFKEPIDPHADRAAQRATVRKLVAPVASRAFRRRATPEELDALVRLYDDSRDRGESPEQAVRIVLSALLVSPSFLFRIEADPPPGEVRDLDDIELASRLSYFLWSSMPDDPLFRAAMSGQLHTDDELVAAALRMLRDPKARALIDNFAGQWLQLRSLDTFAPDPKRFPDFDEPLRRAMRRETEEFFRAIVVEDRSILEFLDADTTFVNARLAKHYGLADVPLPENDPEAFVRVSVDRATRGGLLGQAAILAVTSNPTRTSPVKRGKWILENLFAAPPPPAPPNVPELPEATEQKPLTGTLRQRMEQHRTDPGCAACHRLMDPLGFGLENYDPVGGWRTADGDSEVDASGELPDGRSFRGPGELKALLKEREHDFRRCLAEKLLTYALGRGLEWYDACAVERIATRCREGGDRFSVLVAEIVKSPAFRQREAPADR